MHFSDTSEQRRRELSLTILGQMAACGPANLEELYQEVHLQAPPPGYNSTDPKQRRALLLEVGNMVALLAVRGFLCEYDDTGAFEPSTAGLRFLERYDVNKKHSLEHFRRMLARQHEANSSEV